jgi:Flp pilus assembly protein TadD
VLKSQTLKARPGPSLAEPVLKAWRRAIDRLCLPIGRSFTGNDSVEVLYLQARARARFGDFEEAARQFAVVTERAPTFADAFEDYAELLDRMGRDGLARRTYDIARKLRQDVGPPAADRCMVLRQRPSLASITAYTAVLRSGASKRRALTYIARGNAYLVNGRAKLALLDYGLALRLAPRSEVIALKAEALAMLGRHDQAVAAFDAAAAGRPDDADIRGGRAIAQLALGRLEEADRDWRRQLALLAADRATARACVLLRLADYHAALPELQRSVEKEPGNPYWRLYHGAALCRLARPADPPDPTVTSWPAPLLALQAGRISAEDALRQADSPARRAEAMFQIGIFARARDCTEAGRWWEMVVDTAAPAAIEYAAARHELARLPL